MSLCSCVWSPRCSRMSQSSRSRKGERRLQTPARCLPERGCCEGCSLSARHKAGASPTAFLVSCETQRTAAPQTSLHLSVAPGHLPGSGGSWAGARRRRAGQGLARPASEKSFQSSLTPARSYTQNGILHMLDRNKRIKPRPERFQNCRDLFDLILTCEERVYDQVVEGKAADRSCLLRPPRPRRLPSQGSPQPAWPA